MQPGPAFVGASWCLPFDTSQFWSLPPGSQPRSANLWHDSIAVSHVVNHPPQSRLSLTPEHNVVVLGGASLRKSLQSIRTGCGDWKRKSLNASLKQWHFFSNELRLAVHFYSVGGIFLDEILNTIQRNKQLAFVQEYTKSVNIVCFSVASYSINTEHYARKSAAAIVQECTNSLNIVLFFCSKLFL